MHFLNVSTWCHSTIYNVLRTNTGPINSMGGFQMLFCHLCSRVFYVTFYRTVGLNQECHRKGVIWSLWGKLSGTACWNYTPSRPSLTALVYIPSHLQTAEVRQYHVRDSPSLTFRKASQSSGCRNMSFTYWYFFYFSF